MSKSESESESHTSNKISVPVKEVSLTIHDILRYVFTGVLAVFVGDHVTNGNLISSMSGSLGTVAALGTIVISIGALIYLVSRILVVEPSVRIGLLLRTKFAWFKSWTGQSKTRHEFFHDRYKLDLVEAELAHFVLRATKQDDGKPFWDSEIQSQFFRQHSENHLIFAASFILACTAVYIPVSDLSCCWIFLYLSGAVLLFVTGCVSDIRVFMREATLVQAADEKSVTQVLSRAGLRIAGEQQAAIAAASD